MDNPLGSGEKKSGSTAPGLFEVWVEVRCSVCPEQIAGAFVTEVIPHRAIANAARQTGATRVGDRWLCRHCAARISERKRHASGRV